MVNLLAAAVLTLLYSLVAHGFHVLRVRSSLLLVRARDGGTGESSGAKPSRRPKFKPKPSLEAAEDSWRTTRFSDEQEQSATTTAINVPNDELGEQPGGEFRSGFVSIVGNANVGKSTLMNAVLGQDLSIVSPKPQTTRHRILGVVTNSTYQLIFSDTPGMLAPVYKLHEAMMDSVRLAAGDADVVCLVTDVYGEALADDRVMQKLLVTSKPVIVVINKVDLVGGVGSAVGELLYNGDVASSSLSSSSSGEDGGQAPVQQQQQHSRRRLLLRRAAPEEAAPPALTPPPPPLTSPAAQYELELEQLKRQDERADQQLQQQQQHNGKRQQQRSTSQPLTLPQLKALWSSRLPRCRILPVSAISSSPEQNNISPLVSLLVSLCPRGPKYFHADTLTNRDERFFTTEIIRESLLACYQDEVPYSCEVVIESFKDEGNGGLSRISAIIVVAQNSHKAILIGKQGSKLKEVGTMARLKLEKFLDRRVFLALHVKVDEDWRSNQEALERYGYMQTADSDFG